MWVEASAPSNIALIKYMGKIDMVSNKPCNPSLSYTLNHLRTFVRIKKSADIVVDQWSALLRTDLRPIQLSEKGLFKFFSHFNFLKKQFALPGFFQIQSANNFPSDCGLASSASSYAALTLALHDFGVSTNQFDPWPIEKLALLSKSGSGSSCRSFFSPWAIWSEASVQPLQIPSVDSLKHQVILCDESIKPISSSQAHKRVLTSDLFKGRPERAELRLTDLISSLNKLDWKKAFEICWNEFWDMHLLFHTSTPPFMYMNADSQYVLTLILNYWEKNQDGPLVTMDAGSNIHLLYRQDQIKCYNEVITLFRSKYAIWTDEGYLGPV